MERDFPGSYKHGDVALEEFYCLDAKSVSLLSGHPDFSDFDPEKTLFLDVETTGLAGGAGTYVFLVGLGYFFKGRFQTEQLFLPDFQSEQAFLEELRDRAYGPTGEISFRYLVSFNGKSYDLNLLDNRFLLRRADHPFRRFQHLDLLHPSRLLWRGRFRDCALQTIESHVLGLRRKQDIPSALIPQVYFNYLRTGQCGSFREIFEHNRLDLLALVALLILGSRLIREPDPCRFVDPLSAARFHLSRGNDRQAAELLEDASRQSDLGPERLAVLFQLVLLKRKLGQSDEALRLCDALIREHPRPPLEIFEQAAKILEHKKRAFESALEVVARGLECHRDCAALQHRQFRLKCRLAGKKWY